jgi:integrase/recombinase XerD
LGPFRAENRPQRLWEAQVSETGQELTIQAPIMPSATAMPAAGTPVQAKTDAELVALWLHGRGKATTRAYEADAAAFLAHAGKDLRAVTLGNVQAFVDSLAGLAPASRARRISVVKSLLSFAHRVGYVVFNVGAAVRLPPVKGTLAERILAEADVLRLIHTEADPRNAALLRLTYAAGLRISEAVGLCWRDLVARDDAGQVTVLGKGGKTRAMLLSPETWRTLMALRGDAGNPADPDAPVFRSAKSGPLGCPQAHRILKAAAGRAGLPAGVSMHWLRHAHVSHALDRGAPAHLVQATVGHASLATTSRYAHARPNDSSARYLAV